MTDVSISPDLKAIVAQCKPGQSKTLTVTYTMGNDGKATFSPASETTEEAGESAPKSKPAAGNKLRPKPVMNAIAEMY